MERKLEFELVPEGCWYSNLRSLLKPREWDMVRKDAYARAGGRCMICGRKTQRLEAHERWEYDEEQGCPEKGIAPGTKWENVPEDFECPLCGVAKDMFNPAE